MMPKFRIPEITYPLVIDTLGKTLATGQEISVHCHINSCHHSGRINLVRLGYRLGFDHGCMDADLRPYFYCLKCRTAGRPDRDISFRCRALTDPFSKWPRSIS